MNRRITNNAKPISLHPRQKEIYDDTSRRRCVAAGRRFGKCVAGNTLVTMADGTQKKVTSLKVGDVITAYEMRLDRFVPRRVMKITSQGVQKTWRVVTRHRSVYVSGNHPFLVGGQWVDAENLTSDMTLTILEDGLRKFENVRYVKEARERELFDIEVEFDHTFCANGIVTHNTSLARAEILRAASKPGSNVWYVAPTYRMAKQIMWRDLMKEIPPAWIKSSNSTLMDITLKNGSVISLRGCDKESSLRGVEVTFLVMDEMQEIKPSAWEEVLRPTLAKTRGRVLFLGCVTGDTLVSTPTDMRQIDTFDAGNGPKSLTQIKQRLSSINDEWDEADGFFDNGYVPVRKITTKCGYSLTASLPHPVLHLREDGTIEWKKNKDFRLGDRIAVCAPVAHESTKTLASLCEGITARTFLDHKDKGNPFHTEISSGRLAFVAGLFTMVGNVRNDRCVTFTLPDKDTRHKLLDRGGVQDGSFSFKHYRDRPNRVFINGKAAVQMLEALGCDMNVNTHSQKKFPTEIFALDTDSVGYFISGLIEGSGDWSEKQRLAVLKAPKEQIRLAQILLLRLQVFSQVKKERNSDFQTLVVSAENFDLMRPYLKFSGKGFSAIDEEGLPAPINHALPLSKELLKELFHEDFHGDVFPHDLAKFVANAPSETARKIAEDICSKEDYLWDEIASIEVGHAHTYDFTIPKTHAFWTNGIISHNTPKSRNYFYKLWKLGQRKEYRKAGMWKSWQIKTIESPFIPIEEIEEARADMDERTFKIEFEAEFSLNTGAVYYNFLRERNVKPCKFNPNLPIWVGQDFNVSPMSSVIMQPQPNGEVWVIDEIYMNNSNTVAVCNELERRYWKYARNIVIYPDPAGGARSTARGESDLDVFRERGFRRIKYRKQHPLVADRVNAVNKVLLNAEGRVRLFIDPKCKHLIESFEQTLFKEGTNEIDKKLNVEHITDALGYPIEIEFPRRKIELIGISI